MLTTQLEQIIAINGSPEERFERTEIVIPGGSTVSLSFGWWTPVYTRVRADCVYGNPIGCIDQVLLNRLEANVDFVSRLCEEYHIKFTGTTVKDATWTRVQYVYYNDLKRIRDNIKSLRDTGFIESSTPDVQLISANAFPNYLQINEWEKCLLDIRLLIAGSQTNLRRPLGTFSLSSSFGHQVIRR